MKKILQDLDNLMYKAELDSYKTLIRSNQINIRMVSILLLNIFSFIFTTWNLIHQKDILLYSVLVILLAFSTWINFQTIKNCREKIKQYKIKCDDILKIMDPLKFIKDQRKEKLKKLNKFNLFH